MVSTATTTALAVCGGYAGLCALVRVDFPPPPWLYPPPLVTATLLFFRSPGRSRRSRRRASAWPASTSSSRAVGALHTVKAALPHMVRAPLDASEPKRRVVFVNSAAGLTTFIGYTQYSSSKYAVRGLSDALRNELLLYDVETTVYYPGNIDTPLYAHEQPLMPEEAKAINGTSSAVQPEDAARTLIQGIAKGEYAVTNEAILQVLRTVSNGVAPRLNTPLEILLLPICVLIQTGFLYFMDFLVKKSARQRNHKHN